MKKDLSQLRAGISFLAEIFSITYWVPHEDDQLDEASLFQGFLPGILGTEHLFNRVVKMPLDMRELFADRAAVLNARQAGIVNLRILPVQLSAFEALLGHQKPFFHVVLTTGALAQRVADLLESRGLDWLHFSESSDLRTISIEQVSDRVFEGYLRRVADSIENPYLAKAFVDVLGSPLRKWLPMSVDCPSYAHNLTGPNETALAGMCVDMRGVEPMGPWAPNLYSSGSVRCARAVRAIRDKIIGNYGLARHVNDLTICVDSVAWWLSRTDIRQNLIRRGLSPVAANFVNLLVNRRGYASVIALPDRMSAHRLSEEEDVQLVLATRSKEMRTITSALALHSGFTLTPVVRLSPAINTVRPSLLDIGSCARGNGPHRDFKLNKLARRLSAEMVSIVGSRMVAELRGAVDRIGEMSLIADLPLELISIDGVPLSLKHDVSRIPCNPGNVMFSQCVRNDITFVSKESFDDVLVVRSFSKTDPIAGHLEAAISDRVGVGKLAVPRVRFQDVASAEEFVEAVASFKGSLMIFDGHGSRDSQTGVGSLVVGGRPLDIWDLKSKLTLPPIVLLSACDTFPIDGSHGSSAVGMLALGAKTVLGTLLPVHSIRSSVLLALLLLRISEFLPIVMEKFPHGVNWRYFMGGLLRMAYARELGISYALSVGMDLQTLSEVLVQANVDINLRDPRWLVRHQRRLAAASGRPLSKVEIHREKYAWLTDSMSYAQLGRPELIHIVDRPPAEMLV